MSREEERESPSFEALFDRSPTHTAMAHGRVNLIGEHTDYNDGFVLPTPIPQRIEIEIALRTDDRVRGFSAGFRSGVRDVRDDVVEYRLGRESRRGEWIDYLQGTTLALRVAGLTVRGFDLRVVSDVPVGAGLSSSAALEVALLRALREALGLDLDPTQLARFGQLAETDFIGAPIGIMDQMSASIGVHGEALFIDTRTLEYERIRLPSNVELVVISSGITHAHATGEYRIRRQECEDAARGLGVDKLRDADLIELERSTTLPAPLDRRVRHVVSENARVLEAVRAIKRGDPARLGELFYGSHASMRDDFEVSIPEIDLLVELAAAEPDVFGARLTGGGFGGSVVILAREGSGRRVGDRVAAAYRDRTRGTPSILLPPPE